MTSLFHSLTSTTPQARGVIGSPQAGAFATETKPKPRQSKLLDPGQGDWVTFGANILGLTGTFESLSHRVLQRQLHQGNEAFENSLKAQSADGIFRYIEHSLPSLRDKAHWWQPLTTWYDPMKAIHPSIGVIGRPFEFMFPADPQRPPMALEFDVQASPLEASEPNIKAAHIRSRNLVVQTRSDGRIQIYRQGKPIFVTREHFDTTRWGDEASRTAIANGIRWMDPHSQKDWTKAIGRQWPPCSNTNAGPVNIHVGKNAIFMVPPVNSSLGESYGIRPQAMVTIDPKDESIIIATQVENTRAQDDIRWAPWIIAPIKIPEIGFAHTPPAMLAFPVHRQERKQFKTDLFNTLANKWNLNNNLNFIYINPYAQNTGESAKKILDNTNWVMMAERGSDAVMVMRSMQKHPEHFHAYAGGASYVEMEFTGQRVPFGEKSTVITKIDFIPLSELTIQFKRFGDTGNLEHEMHVIGKKLEKRLALKQLSLPTLRRSSTS